MHDKGLFSLQDKGFHSLSHPRGVGCTNTTSSRANNMDQSMRFKHLPIDALELAHRSRLVMVFLVLLMRFPCSH